MCSLILNKQAKYIEQIKYNTSKKTAKGTIVVMPKKGHEEE